MIDSSHSPPPPPLDISATAAPKSDQLNADDLFGGPLEITITHCELRAADLQQPLLIYYMGCDGRPYKPCKSMRRVLIAAWGYDATQFAGRRLRLYRDDRVSYGGNAVGGIRISHMSDIEEPLTLLLTVRRAARERYTVEPLPRIVEVTHPGFTEDQLNALRDRGQLAAEGGTATLQKFWKGLSAEQKRALKPDLDEHWKPTAAHAEQTGQTATQQEEGTLL